MGKPTYVHACGEIHAGIDVLTCTCACIHTYSYVCLYSYLFMCVSCAFSCLLAGVSVSSNVLADVFCLHIITRIRMRMCRLRFHVVVSEAVEPHPIAVMELQQPMSRGMIDIQTALMEVIDVCVSELGKTVGSLGSAGVDLAEFSMEQAMSRTFDRVLRHRLDPIWHRLGAKTRHLVDDLKTLRKLLG
jgi:hypothetical protein